MSTNTNVCPFCQQTMRDDSMTMMGRVYDLHSCFNWECDYWSTTLSMEEWQQLKNDPTLAAQYRKSAANGKQMRRDYEALQAVSA